MKCPNCHHSIEKDDMFCGECGTKLTGENPLTTSEPQTHIEQETEASNKIVDENHNNTLNKATSNPTVSQQTSTSETIEPFDEISEQSETHKTSLEENLPHNHDKVPLNAQIKEVTSESKGFFKSTFTATDAIIHSAHTFSYKLLVSLIIIGLIITTLLISLLIPSEISVIAPKSRIVSSLIFNIIVLLVIIVLTTLSITKLIVTQPISFKKVLSDFVLINSISVALFFIAIILFITTALKFGGITLILSILILIISGIYLITKYSSNQQTKFSSFYGVILYLIVMFIFAKILGEMAISNVMEMLNMFKYSLFEGLFHSGGRF